MLSRTGLLNISVAVLPLVIAGTVVVGRDPAEEPLGWMFFGILILLAAGASAFVQSRVQSSSSSSLGGIVEALRGVSQGNFSTLLDAQGAGEYTELVEVTNESLNQIGGVM